MAAIAVSTTVFVHKGSSEERIEYIVTTRKRQKRPKPKENSMTDSEILQRYVDEMQPITGWPNWRTREYVSQMISYGAGACYELRQERTETFVGVEREHEMADYVALCIWRDWARSYALKSVVGEGVLATGNDDEMLIAAAMAAPEEKP